MLIYSETINTFLQNIRHQIREILEQEMGLTVHRQRFEYAGLLYPINPVVFEHEKMLGYFEPHAYQIGINSKLIGKASHAYIRDILRHELCHFYLHLQGNALKAHGPEFRIQCQKFGWDSTVSAATTDTGAESLQAGAANAEERKILEKVKKLLCLSESSNVHEAEIATAKANQLILEHNLQIEKNTSQEEIKVYVSKVLTAKRNNQKMKSIYEILRFFMVQPVFSYSQSQVALEVIGEKIHVEMADYLAKFFSNEMERLWKIEQRKNPQLKGLRSKNSFFAGLAKGFITKIQQQRQSTYKNSSKELVVLEKQLAAKVKLVYSRLGSTSQQEAPRCSQSLMAGHKAGSGLNIRKGIHQKFGNRLLN